jgi:hypothetical protein
LFFQNATFYDKIFQLVTSNLFYRTHTPATHISPRLVLRQ